MRIWLAARRPDLYKNPSELKRKVKAAFLQFSRIWKRRVKPNAQRAELRERGSEFKPACVANQISAQKAEEEPRRPGLH